MSEDVMLQAGNAVDKHHALAKQMLAAGLHEAAAVRNIVEKSLYEEIFLLMQGQHIKDEQHCLLHGGSCCTWDVLNPSSIVIVTFGSCCYDHSVMNKSAKQRGGVVGHTILPWAVCALHLQLKEPDVVIEECTRHTDRMVPRLMQHLGPAYDQHTFFLCQPLHLSSNVCKSCSLRMLRCFIHFERPQVPS